MDGEKVQMAKEAAAPSLSPAPVEGKPREAAVGEKGKATEEPAPAESDLSDASESAAAAATIADDGGKPASEAAVAEDELPYDCGKYSAERFWIGCGRRPCLRSSFQMISSTTTTPMIPMVS
ncbi:Os11g0272300 [Oryza sativa Japonica Group]|uniref:Os11g0272300 protein n=1 Tax=Oryza sativa subsp. japonica TaxID=39947 RepID=A0A0P0Y1C5_ORYSJ|nr:Os11g0272300 [Oryza sativa Japonica Group]